jgi:mannose-1-phosphate guanylyltransferase/phosphomannomutase
MLPLFDRPIIEHTVELLAKHRIREIVVAASAHTAELAQHLGDGSRLGVKLRYSIEREPLGTAGAIRMASRMIGGTFMVVSSDVVTDCDLKAAIRAHKSSPAVATVLTSKSKDPSEFGIVEADESGWIRRMLEKPRAAEVFSNEVSAGIYIFEPEVISSIPHFQSCDLATEVLPRLLSNNDPVQAYHIPGYWRDVNSLVQSKHAHFDTLEGKLKIEIPAEEVGPGIWIGDRVEIDASVQLIAPVYLGTGVRLRQGASVGPKAVIGAETAIEQGARVANSLIGDMCLVGRSGSIRNSVIGSGCATSDGEQMDSLTVFEHANYEHTSHREAVAPAPRIEVHAPSATDPVSA